MGKTFRGTGFRHTDTSLDAALQVERVTPNIRAEVLAYLRLIGRPASSADIAESIKRPECSIRPRLTELKDLGKIRDSGMRGLTEWGRPCILWQAIERSA